MAKVDWNPGEYETGRTFEVMPRGRYLTMVADSELKKTKAGDGSYLEFEFRIVRPDAHKNRPLWARLNVKNPSQEAQRIGREQFNALCEACGMQKEQVDDTAKLHNKPVICIVDVEKSNRDPNKEVNVVTGWLKPSQGDASVASSYKVPTREQRAATKTASAAASNAGAEQRREQARANPVEDDIPF